MIKRLLLLVFLVLSNTSFTQQLTYFIKYKNTVPATIINSKVTSQKLLDGAEKSIPGVKHYSVNRFAKNLGKDDENLSRIVKVTFTSQAEAIDFISHVNSDNTVEYIQPQITYKVDLVPNDSLVNEQWSLKRINAFDAWNISTGSDSVLLAIIDTGIEFFHPDLVSNIFYNQGEAGSLSSNGVDDDNNGFIDDYMGWDFTDRIQTSTDTSGGDFAGWDNYPFDRVPGGSGYHGTFVAGIAGAAFNNSTGIAGAAPGIKLLNLRAFDNSGSGDEDDAAAAILYAIQMGAKIINMSWGDYSFSYVLRDVVRYAHSRNVVLVASSGNSGSSSQLTAPHYPSGYPEVISVGNSTENDYRAANSVYGQTLDLVAPGSGIISTYINSGYVTSSGTSASAPLVSAAAALVLSIDNFTNEEVKQIIKSSTDDIDSPGWDTQTGAGRLNIFKTLKVLSPGKIVIKYPSQDFSTRYDTVNVSVTVMSPYFISYSLFYGSGINPTEWKTLISGEKYQVLNKNISILNTAGLPDGDYTIKLVVEQSNGRTTEERVNFHIQRGAPEIILAGIGPLWAGDKSTIMAELFTNQLTSVKMFYRVLGSPEFNFVTLDGFTPNSGFIKQEHFGFIPVQYSSPSTEYEIYFEAENLAGLVSKLTNSDGSNFIFITDHAGGQAAYSVMPYTLPRGTVFKKPVNFLSDNFNELLFKAASIPDGPDSIISSYALYKEQDGTLIKNDSISNREPVDAGDFNNNGKTELLSVFNLQELKSYIDEQSAENTFQLNNKLTIDYKKSLFYPVITGDINNDGNTEIYTNYYDSLTRVWNVNSELQVTKTDSLKNYSFIYPEDKQSFGMDVNVVYRNSFITADTDGDDRKELWMADIDGDLISFRNNGSGFVKGDSLIERVLRTNSEHIMAAGDVNGDGSDEIIILYNSNIIAPYYVLRVINFKIHQPEILFEKVFLDLSNNSGFSFDEYHQSVGCFNIDSDEPAEIVVNVYPFVYIYKFTETSPSLVFFDKGVNTEGIFCADLNQNGINEIGLQYESGYSFFEFSNAVKPPVPSDIKGFSIRSGAVKLEWSASSPKYLIYKGTEPGSLILFDSVVTTSFLDSVINLKTKYYYGIKSVDPAFPSDSSAISDVVAVYAHIPASVINAESETGQTVEVYFSDMIRTSIENIASFEVPGAGAPNSITASSQTSYLLSFKDNLPVGENFLIIKNLNDYYGSPVTADTVSFVVKETTGAQEFFISAFEIINPYKVKVIFNLDVNNQSALNTSNYSFDPPNNIQSVSIDNENENIVYIELAKEKPVGSIGREYVLKIENLISASGTTINSGAGSYVVLTGSAENLADVYVYPSPVKMNDGITKMMFANLPARAKISILTLTGHPVRELEESDGNGGIEYDLKDNDGALLNSGVYIFRVLRLDGSNNEVEEKLGKFVIIR